MSIDTVNDLTPRVQYEALAAQVDFDYPFPIFQNADLVVLVDGVAQALNTDYSVTGAGNDTGGAITFSAPMAGGEIVTIYRDIAIERDTDISQNGQWLSSAYNDEQDKIFLILQQLKAQIARSLRLPITAEVADADIELGPAFANTYLTFDADLKPTPALLSATTMTQAIIGTLRSPMTLVEQAVSATPINYAYDTHEICGFVLPERYGAVGNGNAADIANGVLDTAAINTAISVASATGCPIVLSRAYIAVPGTAQTGAASYNCAFVVKSNVTFLGHNGGSIKMQNGYSTNVSPKEMAMFSWVSAGLSKVNWLGLTMDMNGANNLISPARPASYNRFNHAAIMGNGPTGGLDDVKIEGCTLQNTAGVCYIVPQLVAAGTTPVMPKRWTVKKNRLLNGGSDTDDFTAVFLWAEDSLLEGNTMWQDSPPHTVGLTGGMTGFEVHGARSRFVNNLVYNFRCGGIVSSNFTNPTTDVVVAHNTIYASDYGILFYRQQVGGQTEVKDVLVSKNTFYFNANTTGRLWSDGIATRACFGFEGGNSTANQLAVNNIKISGNVALDDSFGSTSLRSCFVKWDTCQNVASQVCSNLEITDNTAIGFTTGVDMLCAASGASNSQGFTEITDNKFISLSPDSGALYDVAGIKINATTGFKTLILDGNKYIDERGSPSFLRGVLLVGGTITDLCYGQQFFKGLTGTIYQEVGVTVTNRKGSWVTRGVTGSVATATAISHGLPGTPSQVLLTQLDGTPTGVFPSALGATTFTLNFTGGGNHAFNWQASIGSSFP